MASDCVRLYKVMKYLVRVMVSLWIFQLFDNSYKILFVPLQNRLSNLCLCLYHVIVTLWNNISYNVFWLIFFLFLEAKKFLYEDKKKSK